MIWCEDHGDLAFLNLENDFTGQAGAVERGDLLEFVSFDGPDMREARQAVRVSTEFAPELAHLLDETAGAAPQAADVSDPSHQGAQVIPFPRKTPVCNFRRKRAVS